MVDLVDQQHAPRSNVVGLVTIYNLRHLLEVSGGDGKRARVVGRSVAFVVVAVTPVSSQKKTHQQHREVRCAPLPLCRPLVCMMAPILKDHLNTNACVSVIVRANRAERCLCVCVCGGNGGVLCVYGCPHIEGPPQHQCLCQCHCEGEEG